MESHIVELVVCSSGLLCCLFVSTSTPSWIISAFAVLPFSLELFGERLSFRTVAAEIAAINCDVTVHLDSLLLYRSLRIVRLTVVTSAH